MPNQINFINRVKLLRLKILKWLKKIKLINNVAFEEGVKAFNNSEWMDAAEKFQISINDEAPEPIVYRYKGICMQNIGFHFTAIKTFHKAIEINPTDCNLYFLCAQSYYEVQELNEAIKFCFKSIVLAELPSTTNDLYNLQIQEAGYKDVKSYYQSYLLVLQYMKQTKERLLDDVDAAKDSEEKKLALEKLLKWKNTHFRSVEDNAV
jgi:tetratricopeptide (TPR) repeat protein